MKLKVYKLIAMLIITLANLLISSSVFAQVPEKMSYQAVIRNGSNVLVTNAPVGMRISILQGVTPVYVETHVDSTNANGLVSIEIGTGTTSDDFSSIDWSAGTYFIKTETDPDGGTNYTIIGTSQILSVPYALHAKTADSISGGLAEADPIFDTSVAGGITGTDTTNWNNKQEQLTAGNGIDITGNVISVNKHYVGELYGGGVVFWVDQTGQHGLICSMVDISAGVEWSDVISTLIGTTAQSDWDGQSNSNEIIAQSTSTSAADLCDTYTNADYGTGTFSDWYLPSRGELNDLWNNSRVVQKAIDSDGNGSTTILEKVYYWSSSEYDQNGAWIFDFSNGGTLGNSKDTPNYVRAVRAF